MDRIHLVEIEDLPWFPHLIRGYMTDTLNFAAKLYGPFLGRFVALLAHAMKVSGKESIIDLCSGSGGPIEEVVRRLHRDHALKANAFLTDLFPSEDHRSRPNLFRVSRSVDATNVPPELEGFRTLFNGFHHFRPDGAKRILVDAAKAEEGIAIFELTKRSPFQFLLVFLFVATIFLTTPFYRPFRITRLLFTYLLPIVPLFTLWDGLVSCLRVYSVRELERLVKEINAKDYRWDIGTVPMGPSSAIYLIGTPSRGNPG